jgi:ankyrin repeat protein
MIVDYYTIVRRAELAEFKKLPQSAIINFENNYGENLLHTAIVSKSLSMVEAVLSAGVDVNKQTKKGSTPLHFAVDRDWFETCSLLIDNGALVNLSDSWGNQPLWVAVFNVVSNYEIVELLIAHGGNPNHVNLSGKSSLDFAQNEKQNSILVNLMLPKR